MRFFSIIFVTTVATNAFRSISYCIFIFFEYYLYYC